MATVEKKPRKLPKLKEENNRGAKGDAAKDAKKTGAKEPQTAKQKELPPLKRVPKKGFSDTKSMVNMGESDPVEVNQRSSLTANSDAKVCNFFVDNDYRTQPIKVVITPYRHRKLATVTDELTRRMKLILPFGVRGVYTPRARDKIRTLDDFTHDGDYICTESRKGAHGLDIARVQKKRRWHHARPDSGQKRLNAMLKDVELRSGKHRAAYRPGYDLSNAYQRLPPKKVTVMKNGEPDKKHLLLLNRRLGQTFEQVLQDLSEMFGIAVRKIYTIDGHEIRGLQMLLKGPDVVVVVPGTEQFINLSLSQSRARTRNSMGSRPNLQSRVHDRLQSRRDRHQKTKGCWKVTVRTNALPYAGTQAQVTITVYGHKGNSGPLTLGSGDGRNFQSGMVDEFQISVGNVGDVYKIRLAHDNSGDFPGWLCDEVQMTDVDSREELSFSCRRWLARDEDDQEITRELAVKRPGDPILPLIKYQVDVYTGDMWGGGTEANVYITIYGDRGDTGVRQLYAQTKGVYFKQGQLDSFEVEAVSLGHLKRIIIGHDGTGPGQGWYLDKIVIREPPFKSNTENVFYCGKWLDEGEDDGKIVRELRVQDEYMDDILEKRNWEYEKWKYEKDCKVMLFSVMTGKALELNKDLRVDGFAEEKNPLAVFNVHIKKPMKPMFCSQAISNHFLAIDAGKISGLGKGGPYCEFRVRVQQDRTTLFEAVKSPLQFLSIGADGYPAEVRGILDKEPSKRFYVYAKGIFRHKGVVMLGTSLQQTISVNDDGTMTGRGRRTSAQSHFRVHKVSPGGVRMFESVAKPGSYIRLKDGKIDCNGARTEESHFLVLRHKDKGYITLQSSYQRGLFVGMTTDGRVHTTIDTGVRNIWLYPEVVEWGIPKTRSTAVVEQEVMEAQREMTPLSRMSNKESDRTTEFAGKPKKDKLKQKDEEEEEMPVSFEEEDPDKPEEPVEVTEDTNEDETEEEEQIPIEEGDWGINVSTLSDLTNGDVALVAYGDKGSSGAIILGAPPGKPVFQEGNDDEFRNVDLYGKANLLKIGRMFKIRLELIPRNSTKPANWRVKEVRMQDLNTNEVLKFSINRWLSREEDDHDIMREAPVVRPGENVLPVHIYEVSIHTGSEKGAETDADVYITAYGERGDWGKRYLQESENIRKFRVGQVDKFYIEAVSLGNIQRCVIGHDGTGAGEGWFCDQIVIKESETAHTEYVFPCNRWLDTGMEDRKIERPLVVKETSTSKARRAIETLESIEEEEESFVGFVPPTSASPAQTMITLERQLVDRLDETKAKPGGKTTYLVEVTTGAESGSPNGGRVHLTLYGSEKKSDQIMLYSADPNKKTYEPGNVDTFTIETDDLGMLYKVRMGREDSDTWDRWFLDELKLTDQWTNEVMTFSFNRWLARDMEDGDLDRELPVVLPGKPHAVLHVYQVQVYTGDHWGASTDANMYITLCGTHGDSGKRLLHKCNNNRVKFQRGQMDVFKFEVVNLEELTSVVVSHDGRGHGAGIFLEKVVVKETDTDASNLQYVFPCGRWLDTHEDDCLTERVLRMIDTVDTNTPPQARGTQKSNGHWTVTVKTSSFPTTSTTAHAFLTIYGSGRHSDRLPLTMNGQAVGIFTPGAESQFQVETGDIGRVTKVRLEHDNFGSSPNWRVDYVKLTDLDSGEDLVFYLDRWLASDQDDRQICREMPAVRKGTAALPVLRYVIAVTTGSYKDAGTEAGNIGIKLIGVDGDTGVCELTGPLSKNKLPWQSGQTDIYTVEAVSVGKLKKIELKFVSTGQDRWYVQQVAIMEGARSPSQFTFVCHQWLLSSDAQLSEFPVTEVEPSTNMIDTLESIPKGLEKPVRSKGRWTVYVQTGSQPDSGTDEKVSLVLCGLKGESEPVSLNQKDSLHPGSFVKFETKVADIGLLFKIRVFFEEKHFGSSWFLVKMKLKDKDTGEEIIFELNDWLESTNENPEGAVELPVTRPDLAPLKEQIYIVSMVTGDLPRSETDSSVSCSLIGQWGSTGQRSMCVSSNKDTFRAGQVDQFTVSSIELGDLQKLIIGHNTPGRGQGWYCDRVTVKVAEETETVFPCERWLDTGCDNRKLEVELLPLTRLPANFSLPTKYINTTGGSWNFFVTYAGQERLPKLKPGHKAGEVSVVVYGSESVQGPLELKGADDPYSPVALLCPGKTETFYNLELSDIGEIEKIRVSSGYEGDTENIWTIQQVVMEEQNTKDRLVFDYRAWVGEVGGDIRKEMMLVKPDMSHKPVVGYYIEVHTSGAEMYASTNANVFITLYGSSSDSGRRHLVRSLNNTKRFQAGQVDKFMIEAVDLGHLEKVVVAKGPGKPWLLEKIIIKRGQYAAEEQIFLFDSWIGDKSTQSREVEETIKLTATIPSHIAVPIEETPNLDVSKGCWTIESVTGGRRGPEGPLDLVVVFCGQQAESKPCQLISNKESPLEIGQTDVFKVKYDDKIGDLRKIRFGFLDPSVDKAWYLRKVTFEDDDTKDMFWSEVNEWVAVDPKLDGWKEVPIPWPAVTLQPVIRYVVTVKVGMVNSDWSESDNVYLIISGDQGGTGRRLLKHSLSNSHKMKNNQVDVFELEAVYLGDLVKLVVGHKNKAEKGGFFLERVTIQESPDAEEVVFECKKWLAKGEADGQIERILLPADGSSVLGNSNNNNVTEVRVPLLTPKQSPTPTSEREPTPVQEVLEEKEPVREPTPVQEVVEEPAREPTPVQEVMEEEPVQEVEPVEAPREPTPQAADEWSITAITGGDAGDGTNSAVVLVLYGAKGHSEPHIVGDSEGFRFSMGNTDTFKVLEEGDLGELYKVRVGFVHSEDTSNATWFIEKLTATHMATQTQYEFAADVCVKETAYEDCWRELPVIRPDNQLPVYTYQVTIYTGEESKAGTDANVYLQIFGECGDTGYRKLMTSKTHTNKLEKGNKDVFDLSAVDLGKLSKIMVKHDGSGPGSGWLLDRVVIKENPDTTIRYVFRYGRWLDEGDGETGVEETLMLSDILVSDEEDKQEDLPGTPWQIKTVTGEEASQGTASSIELILYEKSGHKEKVVVGEKEGFRFSMGETDTFNVRMLEEFDNLYKVRVGFHGDADKQGWLDSYDDAPTWFLQELHLTNEQSGRVYEIQYPTWVRMESYQDHWRELPVVQQDTTMPVVYQYHVEVYTGGASKAGTDANVFLCIHGNHGDTGMRRLMASKTNVNKFEQGNMDLFEVNAVDLGELQKVKVSHDGSGFGSGWFLEKIVVKETEESAKKYVFKCEGWLDVAEGERMASQDFPLSEVLEGEEEEEKPQEVEESEQTTEAQEEKKEPVNFKAGDYKVLVTTCAGRDSGTDSNVILTVYGDADNSGPIQLGSTSTGFFYAGKTDEFDVFLDPEDIGQLRKIRLEHDNSGSAWHVEKVVLRNQMDGTEIVFQIDKWLTLEEPGFDIAVEVPVQGQDWPVREYVVTTWTGDGFGSGTDAKVYVNLIGTLGDSGNRWLVHNHKQTDPFESGQLDSFLIQAVDFGRLMQVKVGHNGKGPGSGWFLKTVRVKESLKSEDVYVFKCEQWLHDDKDDGLTERVMMLDHMEKDTGDDMDADNVGQERLNANDDPHKVQDPDTDRPEEDSDKPDSVADNAERIESRAENGTEKDADESDKGDVRNESSDDNVNNKTESVTGDAEDQTTARPGSVGNDGTTGGGETQRATNNEGELLDDAKPGDQEEDSGNAVKSPEPEGGKSPRSAREKSPQPGGEQSPKPSEHKSPVPEENQTVKSDNLETESGKEDKPVDSTEKSDNDSSNVNANDENRFDPKNEGDQSVGKESKATTEKDEDVSQKEAGENVEDRERPKSLTYRVNQED